MYGAYDYIDNACIISYTLSIGRATILIHFLFIHGLVPYIEGHTHIHTLYFSLGFQSHQFFFMYLIKIFSIPV